MPGKAVGWAAASLPWLCPNTDSLVGLAERPADLARLASADPALTVFLLRTTLSQLRPESFSLTGEEFLSPVILETAAAYLGATQAGWMIPTAYAIDRVRSVVTSARAFARRIATHTLKSPPDTAATVADLAPLGWYGVATIDPLVAAQALHDPAFPTNPADVQTRLWDLDHDSLARRLATRWRLPGWAAMVAGNLNLPFRIARGLVPEPDLFAVVQLAVCEAEDRTAFLGLTRCADRRELLVHLGLCVNDLDELCRSDSVVPAVTHVYPQNPHCVPLVGNLLRAAAASRRRNGVSLVVRLEARIDELHRQLANLGEATEDRLREAKLTGLAELAAGAGHEINNPLAVISGNAQRLIRTEPDPDRGESLRSIVRQTQRISEILRDLMHFARPTPPEPVRFAAAEMLNSVGADIAPLAVEREVRVEFPSTLSEIWLEGDQAQLHRAVLAVTRNGVEAAGRGGWVRLRCEAGPRSVRFVIEDSGPGLTPEAAEHAFDPFFCGRSAGRGRGLGLPTAWRLARENGGDVRHEAVVDGPTRFVVTAPRATEEREWIGRECA